VALKILAISNIAVPMVEALIGSMRPSMLWAHKECERRAASPNRVISDGTTLLEALQSFSLNLRLQI
jgi:hypothetical protein